MFGFANIPLLAACLGMSMFSPEVVALVAAPSYGEAAQVIPIISLSYVFQAWTSYTRIALLQSANTRYLATSTYYTVLLIAGLYLLLIPGYGIKGAAWATVVSMYIRWGLIHARSQNVWPISYPLLRIHFGLVVCVGSYLLWGGQADSLNEFTIKCTIYFLSVVLLIATLAPKSSLLYFYSMIFNARSHE
jgi:O-antigen/teichoic acid export membrane protein